MSNVTEAKAALGKAKAALDAAVEAERLEVLAKRIAAANAELSVCGPKWTVEANRLDADTVCIGKEFSVKWMTRDSIREVRIGPREAHDEDCRYDRVVESITTVTVSVPLLKLKYHISNGSTDHISTAVKAFKEFHSNLSKLGIL